MKQVLSVLDKLGLSLQTFKTALAAALSWIVATNLCSSFPYFAPFSAILTVQVTVADSWEKAAQRIIRLIGGVFVSLILTDLKRILREVEIREPETELAKAVS